MFFICVLKQSRVHTDVICLTFNGFLKVFFFFNWRYYMNVVTVVTSFIAPVSVPALPHWSDTFITVQSSLSFTVRIGCFYRPIQMSRKTFFCLFLLSFVLTLPLHEVMTPVFFPFSHLISFLFLFCFCFCKSILPFFLFFFFYFSSSSFYPTYLFSLFFFLLFC